MKTNTHLYHREVFWKDNFDKDSARIVKSVYRLSKHLKDYLYNDNSERRSFDLNGIWKTIDTLKTMDSIESFEVETENGFLTKCVVRVGYNEKKDICLVFRKGLVVTAWLCNKNDKHSTLDKTKYDRR